MNHHFQQADIAPLNDQLLITEIQLRRPIWDRKHEMHTQRDLIDALWNEIAAILGVPASRARTKWKNLKDQFRREAKRALGEPEYRPRWRLYNSLLFLYSQQNEYLKDDDRNTTTTTISTRLPKNFFDSEFDNSQEINEMPPLPKFEVVENDTDNNTSSFEPETYMSPHLRPAPEVEDPDVCFFKSLVPHMKELSPQKRMELKLKIHEMVYKEVYTEKNKD